MLKKKKTRPADGGDEESGSDSVPPVPAPKKPKPVALVKRCPSCDGAVRGGVCVSCGAAPDPEAPGAARPTNVLERLDALEESERAGRPLVRFARRLGEKFGMDPSTMTDEEVDAAAEKAGGLAEMVKGIGGGGGGVAGVLRNMFGFGGGDEDGK